MTILLIIALLALLILVHELGHFISAKLTGVRVEEFGLGLPPRLFGFHKGDTLYSLNLIPFGGFVRLAGEEDPTVPHSFASKGIKTRALILSSGCLMNALLPIFLLTISFMLPRDVMVGEVMVGEVAPASPAYYAGLLPGDQVLEVNGEPVRNNADLLYAVKTNRGLPINLRLEREGATFIARLTPRWKHPAQEGPLGIAIHLEGKQVVKEAYSPWQAFLNGISILKETFILFKNEVISWVVNRQAPEIGGPIAIVQLTGEVAHHGTSPLLAFLAFLSMNLAIINLFPIPALDGGRIAFVLLEGIRGKRVSPKIERLIHQLGFFLLLILIFAVSYMDILRILRGGSLIP